MKTILKVLLRAGVALLVMCFSIGMFILGLFFFTLPLANLADQFFDHITHHEFTHAYELTSKTFQKTISLEQFESFVQETNLTDYTDSTWSDRSIEDNAGTLKGTISYGSGGDKDFIIYLIKENDSRKISYLGSNITEQEDGFFTMPSHDIILSLLYNTIENYRKAYDNNDVTLFYNDLATTMKKDYSIIEIEKSFFIDFKDKLSFSGFNNYDFIFGKDPIINSAGLLILEGYFSHPILYMGEEHTMYAKLGFINESLERKLNAINIRFYQ